MTATIHVMSLSPDAMPEGDIRRTIGSVRHGPQANATTSCTNHHPSIIIIIIITTMRTLPHHHQHHHRGPRRPDLVMATPRKAHVRRRLDVEVVADSAV
jgi:hypothetical protein